MHHMTASLQGRLVLPIGDQHLLCVRRRYATLPNGGGRYMAGLSAIMASPSAIMWAPVQSLWAGGTR